MNQDKTIAVIMTAYNESEEWIRASIESVLNQTYRNIKLYIMLDNPDNAVLHEIICRYALEDKRITYIRNQKNMGLVAALNELITNVEEDIVARMDADDICIESRIETEYKFMMDNNLDFVMCGIDFICDDKRENGPDVPTIIGKHFNDCEKYGNFATHPTWLLKKEIYDKLNGYRNIKYCEDYDFVLRAIQEGYRCGRIADVLLLYRVRESGISVSYAYEQFEKADYMRNLYKKSQKLSDVNPEELNNQFDNNPDKKARFDKAKLKLDSFARDLYERRLFSCLGNFISGFFADSIYRRLFIYTFNNNLKTKAIFKEARN